MSFDPNPETTRDCFRRMTTDQLLLLRQAFRLDAAERPDAPLVRAFCEARLTIISEVLEEQAARAGLRPARTREGG